MGDKLKYERVKFIAEKLGRKKKIVIEKLVEIGIWKSQRGRPPKG
jgi:hypothetical protein